MLDALIGFSLRNRFIVLLLAALLVAVGIRAALVLPLDAFPDTTPVQVQINAVAPPLSAEEIERQIAFPVELALGGMKGLDEVRSSSKAGFCQVVATFSDVTDIYFARQQINERLEDLQLPEGVSRPTLGPVATGLGEVYHYLLTSEVYDLMELRTLQDWVVRPRLRRVPGVAEVSAWGGLAKQFEVRYEPMKLAKYGLTLDDLMRALRENNQNEGGGNIIHAGSQTLVQGVGRARDTRDLEAIVIAAHEGVPIRVRDVADVAIGYMIRRGGVSYEGKGEAVLGQAFMRMGENSRDVTMALDAALDAARQALPPGVEAKVVYRRTDLVNNVLHTAQKNLFEGAILVIAVLFAFLGNLRAGLIVASVIPLSMLFAVTMMERVGIAGSLLSLGAIDFGLIVDSSVVMVENCVRHLAQDRSDRSRVEVIREAAVEVRKPTMFGELIIMIVYLPILTLEGIEGKLFKPMALTVVFALLGSMVLSLTLMPVLASLGLPRHTNDEPTFIDRWLHLLFQPLLRLGLRFPKTTLAVVAAVTVAATLLGLRLGSEFVPKLSEGAITITTIRMPGISLDEAVRYDTKVQQILLEEFPDEIEQVASWAGAPEVSLPSGYTIEFGGQFKNLLRAERRLWLVVPTALLLILSLLYITFYSLPDALMIFSGVLFARVGGVIGLWVMGLPFTLSAGIGFVALAGASMLEGLVLVSAIRERMGRGATKCEAIEDARLTRLRPVLMTGLVAALGFVPMMLSTGVGSEVQRPLATVVVFGIACDTFLTMLALPVLYLLFGREPNRSVEAS